MNMIRMKRMVKKWLYYRRSVSYTHLDVYKRQAFMGGGRERERERDNMAYQSLKTFKTLYINYRPFSTDLQEVVSN